MPMNILHWSSERKTRGCAHFLIINDPTMTRAPPVAHEGMEAKIGAKKTETKNISPTTTAVIPVFPPSGANMSASCREG